MKKKQSHLARSESCWWGEDMSNPPAEGPGGSMLEEKVEGESRSVEGQDSWRAGGSSAGVWRQQVGPGLLLRAFCCLCSAVFRGLVGWLGRPGPEVCGDNKKIIIGSLFTKGRQEDHVDTDLYKVINILFWSSFSVWGSVCGMGDTQSSGSEEVGQPRCECEHTHNTTIITPCPWHHQSHHRYISWDEDAS